MNTMVVPCMVNIALNQSADTIVLSEVANCTRIIPASMPPTMKK